MMRKTSDRLASVFLLFALGSLVPGLAAGRFAFVSAVECINVIDIESHLLFSLVLSSVCASFLLSVSLSFFLAWYLTTRARVRRVSTTEAKANPNNSNKERRGHP